MKKKSIIVIVMALVMSLALLAGCGQNAATAGSSVSGEA